MKTKNTNYAAGSLQLSVIPDPSEASPSGLGSEGQLSQLPSHGGASLAGPSRVFLKPTSSPPTLATPGTRCRAQRGNMV